MGSRRIAGPNGGSQKGLFLMRYRWFESISLQGRVCEPSVPESPRFGAGSPGGLGGLSRLTPRFTLGEQLLGAPALDLLGVIHRPTLPHGFGIPTERSLA